MEDLFAKLQGILSTKEGQEQLKNISSMLSGSGSTGNGGQQQNQQAQAQAQAQAQTAQPQPHSAQPQAAAFDMSALASMLGGLSQSQGNPSAQAPYSPQSQASSPESQMGVNPLSDALGGIDINMIMQLQQAFQGMNKSDKNTDLLLALKPHFSEKRGKRVDQAISMMRMFSMLPMLKESGIFTGL